MSSLKKVTGFVGLVILALLVIPGVGSAQAIRDLKVGYVNVQRLLV